MGILFLIELFSSITNEYKESHIDISDHIIKLNWIQGIDKSRPYKLVLQGLHPILEKYDIILLNLCLYTQNPENEIFVSKDYEKSDILYTLPISIKLSIFEKVPQNTAIYIKLRGVTRGSDRFNWTATYNNDKFIFYKEDDILMINSEFCLLENYKYLDLNIPELLYTKSKQNTLVNMESKNNEVLYYKIGNIFVILMLSFFLIYILSRTRLILYKK